jgi:hypothetical protein
MKTFYTIALTLAMIAAASAESSTRSFYNERGSFAGSSVRSAIRHGNSTSFYDGRGRYTGSSINTGPRR